MKIESDGPLAKALVLGMGQVPIKEIQLPQLNRNLYFIDEYIYAPRWDCYPVAGEGVEVDVYSRKTFASVARLKVRACDEEQQDNIEDITADKNKMYVQTGFRYSDPKRANYFVFDKASWQLNEEKVVADSDAQSQNNVGTKNELLTKTYRIQQEYKLGNVEYNFYRRTPANDPSNPVATYKVSNRYYTTAIPVPAQDEVIFIGQPDNLGRISVAHFNPASSQNAIFAMLPEITAWAVDDKGFYVSNGVDILVFSLNDFSLRKVIPRVIAGGWKDNGNGVDKNGITKIYFDNHTMIVRTLYGTSVVYNKIE